ncbi:hypothetical protein D046_6054B, partial [Vibrio parahaemolyticus V-223/04]
PEINRLK